MEHVREKIRSTLPSLEEDKLDAVITKLTELGVTHVDDCTFLTAADLDGILSPIQSRRLINAFTSGMSLSCFYSLSLAVLSIHCFLFFPP